MFGFGGYLGYPCRFSWLDWISHGHLTKCEIQWAPSSCQRGWWGLKFGHMPWWLIFCWVRWWNPNQILWKKTLKKIQEFTLRRLLKLYRENWGSLAHWHSHLAHLWRHAIPLLGLQWDTSASWPINSPINQVSHHSETTNYTSVDPKQFTVSKFRLKPVILISECFCSRCGHTNQHPPPTWRETTGDNGRQDHFRAQEGGHTNQHPPPTWRETTGDNGRQDHFRAQEADHTNQHQGGQI